MLSSSTITLALLAGAQLTAAAPTHDIVPNAVAVEARVPSLFGVGEGVLGLPKHILDILDDLIPADGIRDATVLQTVIQGIESDITEVAYIACAYAAVLQAIVPTATPTSIPDALSLVAAALPTSTSAYQDVGTLIQNVGGLVLNSFTPGNLSLDLVTGQATGINSPSNNNPAPPTDVYHKSSNDAPYSVPESSLRSAIYIPSSFGHGKNGKLPVILVPGTGEYGGTSFESNFIKLLSASDFADPVWLNIPGAQLDDAQKNSEYIAYAIGYISSVSQDQNVSVIAWSQGTIDTQWALKYWPSTRNIVSDYVAISADYYGTIDAFVLCPGFPKLPCDPAVNQQNINSKFLTTLRSDGGDSAYVPTTEVHSIFDEVVQPQIDPVASARISDARGVGVTNVQLQTICAGKPAGLVYTHEGVLYNPVAYALAVDALRHDGPGDPARLDLETLCNQVVADGLGLVDVIGTEASIPYALVQILLYPNKSFLEPAIKPYAQT